MCFVFFLQYLDKQSLSYAAVFGLIQDLIMTNTQYPIIYLMSRLPLTKFVGATV
jgi:hypothetical protein